MTKYIDFVEFEKLIKNEIKNKIKNQNKFC